MALNTFNTSMYISTSPIIVDAFVWTMCLLTTEWGQTSYVLLLSKSFIPAEIMFLYAYDIALWKLTSRVVSVVIKNFLALLGKGIEIAFHGKMRERSKVSIIVNSSNMRNVNYFAFKRSRYVCVNTHWQYVNDTLNDIKRCRN